MSKTIFIPKSWIDAAGKMFAEQIEELNAHLWELHKLDVFEVELHKALEEDDDNDARPAEYEVYWGDSQGFVRKSKKPSRKQDRWSNGRELSFAAFDSLNNAGFFERQENGYKTLITDRGVRLLQAAVINGLLVAPEPKPARKKKMVETLITVFSIKVDSTLEKATSRSNTASPSNVNENGSIASAAVHGLDWFGLVRGSWRSAQLTERGFNLAMEKVLSENTVGRCCVCEATLNLSEPSTHSVHPDGDCCHGCRNTNPTTIETDIVHSKTYRINNKDATNNGLIEVSQEPGVDYHRTTITHEVNDGEVTAKILYTWTLNIAKTYVAERTSVEVYFKSGYSRYSTYSPEQINSIQEITTNLHEVFGKLENTRAIDRAAREASNDDDFVAEAEAINAADEFTVTVIDEIEQRPRIVVTRFINGGEVFAVIYYDRESNGKEYTHKRSSAQVGTTANGEGVDELVERMKKLFSSEVTQ